MHFDKFYSLTVFSLLILKWLSLYHHASLPLTWWRQHLPNFHLLSESGLRVGHLNVYHLLNKVPEISSFLNNEHPCIYLLGLIETQIDYRMFGESIVISQYSTFRRDAIKQGETGLAIYIHSSIQSITTRRADLESQSVESLWVKISHSKSPSLLVGFYLSKSDCHLCMVWWISSDARQSCWQ